MPEFRGKKATNALLLAKKSIAKWQSLSLYRTPVDDTGVVGICEVAKDLREVHIVSDVIGDAAMPAMCALPNLRGLLLDGVLCITDAGIVSVVTAPNLRELYLTGTQLTDAGMDAVSNCGNVWSLTLARTQITDAGVACLGRLANLTLVFLNGVQIDGSGLCELPNSRRLDVYVNDCPIIDRGLIPFAETHDGLERLSLNNSKITDKALTAIAELPAIVDLRLEGTAITDTGARCLLGHSTLSMIYLNRTGVSKEFVQRLKSESPNNLIVYH